MKKRKKKQDVFSRLAAFAKAIKTNKPSQQDMMDEVRLMHFRVRPMQGDLGSVDLSDTRFIEALWSLGKLDELYQSEICDYPKKQRDIFFEYMSSMHANYARMLQDDFAALTPEEVLGSDGPEAIEIEIFRQLPDRSRLN